MFRGIFTTILILSLFLSACQSKTIEKPEVTGVEPGEVYSEGIVIDVINKEDVTYTAELDGEPYQLGSRYDENGQHTLRISASLDEQNEVTKINFEIDQSPPDEPVVKGIKEGETHFKSVDLGVRKVQGVTYDFIVNGKEIDPGKPFVKEGTHKLVVTATKENNKLSSSSEITFTIDHTTYTQEEIDYFLSIALETEYGGGSTLRKWEDDIQIKVYGEPTEGDLATLKQVLDELNELIKPITVSLSDENQNISMYFVPNEKIKEYIFSYVSGNWAYFSYDIGAKGNISNAQIAIDSEGVNQKNRDHLIREELTQSLGLGKDSMEYENSIFFQPVSFVNEYTKLDKAVIKLLYRKDLRSGMGEESIKNVLGPRIKE